MFFCAHIVPLRGVGCFTDYLYSLGHNSWGFSPLAGCGLFLAMTGGVKLRESERFQSPCGVWVVSLINNFSWRTRCVKSFSPLAGCGLFLTRCFILSQYLKRFSPLAGCGLFLAIARRQKVRTAVFQSPCGVWVVSHLWADNRS